MQKISDKNETHTHEHIEHSFRLWASSSQVSGCLHQPCIAHPYSSSPSSLRCNHAISCCILCSFRLSQHISESRLGESLSRRHVSSAHHRDVGGDGNRTPIAPASDSAGSAMLHEVRGSCGVLHSNCTRIAAKGQDQAATDGLWTWHQMAIPGHRMCEATERWTEDSDTVRPLAAKNGTGGEDKRSYELHFF